MAASAEDARIVLTSGRCVGADITVPIPRTYFVVSPGKWGLSALFGSVPNFVGRLGRDRQFLRSLSRIFNAGTSRRLHFDYLATALDQREFDTGYSAARCQPDGAVSQVCKGQPPHADRVTGSPSEGLTFGGPTGAYFILLARGAKAKQFRFFISSDMSHSFS